MGLIVPNRPRAAAAGMVLLVAIHPSAIVFVGPPNFARALRAGRADAATQGVPASRLASVRIDDGIAEGGVVSPFYDAMVAKVIVHGRDRDDALRRLGAALEDTPLLGLRNNGRYLRDLARHPEFVAGAVTTKRLDDVATSNERATSSLVTCVNAAFSRSM